MIKVLAIKRWFTGMKFLSYQIEVLYSTKLLDLLLCRIVICFLMSPQVLSKYFHRLVSSLW